MRLVVSEFVSLDGVMEEPMWTFPYWNDEIAAFKGPELLVDSDALLLGRVTYEAFAASWPDHPETGEYKDKMNAMSKHVVTSSLATPQWNASFIKSNVVDEIRKLKQQPGKDLLLFGSCTLVQTLVQNDLVDRYNLLVYPVVLGKGKKLFGEGIETTLKLVESKPYSSGVIGLFYEPAR